MPEVPQAGPPGIPGTPRTPGPPDGEPAAFDPWEPPTGLCLPVWLSSPDELAAPPAPVIAPVPVPPPPPAPEPIPETEPPVWEVVSGTTALSWTPDAPVWQSAEPDVVPSWAAEQGVPAPGFAAEGPPPASGVRPARGPIPRRRLWALVAVAACVAVVAGTAIAVSRDTGPAKNAADPVASTDAVTPDTMPPASAASVTSPTESTEPTEPTEPAAPPASQNRSPSASPTASPSPSTSTPPSSPTPKPTPATTAPASPPPVVHPGSLRNPASGKCLSGGASVDGTKLLVAACTGEANQKWDILDDGTIRTQGLCMDAEHGGTTNGTYLQLVRCNGSPAQQFAPLNTTLYATNASRCVAVAGTAIRLYDCTGSAEQVWNR